MRRQQSPPRNASVQVFRLPRTVVLTAFLTLLIGQQLAIPGRTALLPSLNALAPAPSSREAWSEGTSVTNTASVTGKGTAAAASGEPRLCGAVSPPENIVAMYETCYAKGWC